MSFPSQSIYPAHWQQWRQWQVGQRVMLRYRSGSQPPLNDVLGTLTEITPEALTLQTRQGIQTIALELVVTGKLIPPAPPKRPRPGQ